MKDWIDFFKEGMTAVSGIMIILFTICALILISAKILSIIYNFLF